MLVATGANFPDELTGLALAAKNTAPIFLVGKEIPTATKSLTPQFNNFVILGGKSVIDSTIVEALHGNSY